MKFAVTALLLTTLVLATFGLGAANAVPRSDVTRLDRAAPSPIATSRIDLVCTARGCWPGRPTRRFSWYRPYGYYRPYRGDPRAALGNWDFGVARYGAGASYGSDPRF